MILYTTNKDNPYKHKAHINYVVVSISLFFNYQRKALSILNIVREKLARTRAIILKKSDQRSIPEHVLLHNISDLQKWIAK